MKKSLLAGAAAVMLALTGCAPKLIELSEVDNGKTVECSKGDTITVTLQSNPTTGYSWAEARRPSDQVLVLIRDEFVLLNNDRTMVGVPGSHKFFYEVSGKGTEGINLVYRRHWEKNVEPAGRFQVMIKAK